MIPVVITVYEDRSFTFITKTPPAAVLIQARARQGPGRPNRGVGAITQAQLRQIAERKLPDLNANDIDAAARSSPEPRARWDRRNTMSKAQPPPPSS